MAKFRCPDSSSESDIQMQATPAAESPSASRRVVRKVKVRGTDTKKHARKHVDSPSDIVKGARHGLDIAWRRAQLWRIQEQQRKIDEQQKKIEEQQKLLQEHEKKILDEKARRREAVMKRNERRKAQIRPLRTVWVGNLGAGTSDAQLHGLFGLFGRISEVSIRCARGYACPPADNATPYPGGSQYYALIVYYDSEGARKAMRMDGQILNGRNIVVRKDVRDLPEFRTSGARHMQAQSSIFSRFWDSIKMRTVDRTVIIPNTKDSGLQAAQEDENRGS